MLEKCPKVTTSYTWIYPNQDKGLVPALGIYTEYTLHTWMYVDVIQILFTSPLPYREYANGRKGDIHMILSHNNTMSLCRNT